MNRTRFVKSAITPNDFPPLPRHQKEIAVVGRSNVGKSSLLNSLFGSEGISFVSRRPGKTALLNFFVFNEKISFVDFPGWGYAEGPERMKQEFLEMIRGYFTTRKECSLVLFLFDLRRDPNKEDLTVFRWFKERMIPVLLVLTKSDKFGVTSRANEAKRVEKAFGITEEDRCLFSSLDGTGKTTLWEKIDDALSR